MAGTPRSTNEPLDGHTRQKILDVAAALFREKGYAATTLRDIARRCRIQAASIYYHFASKDDLLLEVFDFGIDKIFQDVQARVGALPPGSPFADRLRAAMRAHVESFFLFGDYTATNIRVFGQAPRGVQKRNLALRDRYELWWKELFDEAERKGDIQPGLDLGLVRLFLFGAMNRTVEWYSPDRGLTPGEIADRFADLVLSGIAPRAASTSEGPR